MARKPTLIAIKDAINAIASLPGATSQAVEETVNYYGQKIIVRHFEGYNSLRYGYPPLDPKYAKRKRRKFGRKPQLVATGKLKNSVTASARAKRLSPNQVALIVSAPSYGYHQIKKGRDWISPNRRDMRDLRRYMKSRIRLIRSRNKTSRRRTR